MASLHNFTSNAQAQKPYKGFGLHNYSLSHSGNGVKHNVSNTEDSSSNYYAINVLENLQYETPKSDVVLPPIKRLHFDNFCDESQKLPALVPMKISSPVSIDERDSLDFQFRPIAMTPSNTLLMSSSISLATPPRTNSTGSMSPLRCSVEVSDTSSQNISRTPKHQSPVLLPGTVSATSTSPSTITSSPPPLPPLSNDGFVRPSDDSKGQTKQKSTDVKDSKRYQCKICDKCFTTSGHLARHTRIHTGERKHVCPFPDCDSRFARQDNCMQHYRTHLNAGKRKRKGRLPKNGALATGVA